MIKTPLLTVDLLIYDASRGIVLVKRGNAPFGYALPGGFVDIGETVEAAGVREALEETGLQIKLESLLGVYSDPARDSRGHTVSTAYIASVANPETLCAGDDAAEAAFYTLDALPPLVFDHARIIQHFTAVLAGQRLAANVSTEV